MSIYPQGKSIGFNTLGLIIAEVLAIEPLITERVPDGSGDGGWIKGLRNGRILISGEPSLVGYTPELWIFLHHFAVHNGLGIRQIMVNRLEAGGILDKHRDGPPADMRYHIPIVTNSHVHWWDEKLNKIYRMPVGEMYGPVDYCGVLHEMVNNGPTDRVHVVVDFYHPTEG